MKTMHRKAIAGLVASALLPFGLVPRPAAADVTTVTGSAFGALVTVSLFGGAPVQNGPAPAVQLPSTGGSQANSLPSMIAQYGPATIFGGKYVDPGRNPSGELKVSTEGQTGPNGFVTSTASVVNVGPGPLIADAMSSTCTARENGVTASTTITNGIVETSYDPATQEARTTAPIPVNPAPNTVIEGKIDHVGDNFRIVFNEQVVDGSTVTVRAAHMYLLGPIAVGDMFVGQSVCGLTAVASPAAPPTTVPEVTTVPETTVPPATTPPETVPRGTDLRASPTRAESDGGGANPLLIGALAAVVVLGVVGMILLKRRRGQPTPTEL